MHSSAYRQSYAVHWTCYLMLQSFEPSPVHRYQYRHMVAQCISNESVQVNFYYQEFELIFINYKIFIESNLEMGNNCGCYSNWAMLTCCKYSLSGKTDSSQKVSNESLAEGNIRRAWNITRVSFKKFLPIMKSSSPPFAGHETNDFLQISGTPGGWAAENEKIQELKKTHSYINATPAKVYKR